MNDLYSFLVGTSLGGKSLLISVMAPSSFSLSMFAPFLRRSKKYKKLETEEPDKKSKDEANDELTRINFKIVSFHFKCKNFSAVSYVRLS